MSLHHKHRLLGAFIWLFLLVIIVPSWYNNPVNFSPDDEQEAAVTTLPTVDHAYRLPIVDEAPMTDGQLQRIERDSTKTIPPPELKKTPDVVPLKPERLDSLDSRFIDKYSNRVEYQGYWIVRLLAFNNTKQANKLATELSDKHPVYIKYFPRRKVYSLRAGPYETLAKAEKAKQKLDKMLRTNGEVKQLPKNLLR